MKNLKTEYENYIAAVEYRAEELPGDLCRMAKTAEQFAPDYGVRIVMSWADNFRAQPVYWPRLDRISKKIKEKEEVDPKEIKSSLICMLANDAIKICPEYGLIATLMVGMEFRQQKTMLHNLDDVKRPYRDKWILETYQSDDVAAWELGFAVGIGLRQVEKVLATGGATVPKATNQRSIFELA